MNIILYIFTVLYIIDLAVIARLDQKYLKIEKTAMSGGVILSILYIIYLYFLKPSSININIIYLGIYVILIAIDTFIIKRYAKESYTVGMLMLFNTILIFTGINIFTETLILAMLEILLYLLIEKIKQKKNGNKKIKLSNIPVGYFVGVSNIFVCIMIMVITNFKVI